MERKGSGIGLVYAKLYCTVAGVRFGIGVGVGGWGGLTKRGIFGLTSVFGGWPKNLPGLLASETH